MTNPDVAPVLTPELPQMKAFLERWAGLYDRVVADLESSRLEYLAQVDKLRLEISVLQQKLNTQAEPYERQIEALRSEIRLLELHVRDAQRVTNDGIERLAPAVEMVAGAKGVTLDGVITQVLLLIDEAKKQFRESL